MDNTSEKEKMALKIKEESLERLLDEIMGASCRQDSSDTFSSSLMAQERQLNVHFDKEKKKRWLPVMTLWLTISILGAFFLGITFGFYWGHNPRTEPVTHSFEKIEEQLYPNNLRAELHNRSNSDKHQFQQEIIEPLSPPAELDPLTPQPLR